MGKAATTAGWVLGFLLGLALLFAAPAHGAECFKSIFAFGDGMFDTGSMSNVFPSMLQYDFPPYGSTHFGRPSGRFSDGRLVLDFLAKSLSLPNIPSYAETVTSDFSSGASFASAYSTIGKVSTLQKAGPHMFLNPFSLTIQMQQFVEFRKTAISVVKQGIRLRPKRELAEEEVVESTITEAEAAAKARLPREAEFTRGLFVVSTGAHDIVNFYNQKFSDGRIVGLFPKLIEIYYLAIRSFVKMYSVKNIIVFDVEPLGCQPFLLTLISHTEKDLDAKGCLIAQNAIVQDFNKQLRASVASWRKSFNANIHLMSQYDLKIDLLKDPDAGFEKTNVACCGVPSSPYNVAIPIPCGPPGFDKKQNATVTATACKDPKTHLYWDGMYTTEAANKYITEKILSGAYFDEPFEAFTSCAKGSL